MWKSLILSSLTIVVVSSTSPPTWDPVYTVRGTLYIPYAEIEEPFEGYYDKPQQRSRIDYYNGMVKTYQLPGVGEYGVGLKLAPVTYDDVLNEEMCFEVYGTPHHRIPTQSIVPDVKGFTLMETVNFRGYKCNVFGLEVVKGKKKNSYKLWVRYKKSKKQPASRRPIPLRYEMRGYNTLLGSHYDHYYLDYDYYRHKDIPDEVFKVKNLTHPCIFVDELLAGHYATFNPMMEFIHPRNEEHIKEKFKSFKRKHGKKYKSAREHAHRKSVFAQNLRYIHSKNRANLGYTLKINHLADRTEDELRALRGFRSSLVYNGGQPQSGDDFKMKDVLPEQYDWRIYGAVTPVKDQSVCGSCWSFGTIGAMEGAYFLKNGGTLVRLSEQVLIDCSWGYGNMGCDGGEDSRAYGWIMQNGGVPTYEDYGGYLGQDGYCHANNVTLIAPITGFVNVTVNDVHAFKVALFRHGPLSVAMDASHRSFSFYANGIYYERTCGNTLDSLDHSVLAVGYGTMNGEPYWLIKNSWSTYWGNDGYALMSARDNNCGIMTEPTYVKM